MFLLAQQLDLPPSVVESYKFGIGLWKDYQQNQSYFYSSTIQRNGIQLVTATDSAIFRLNTNFLEKWEFVGRVDFLLRNAIISPCGNYFWSIEIVYHCPRPSSLIFRRIEVKTLKCEQFQVEGLDPDIVWDIRGHRFYYTKNFGIFLLIQQRHHYNAYSEVTDVIFKFQMNESQKSIHLEHIQLPDLPTVQPYCVCRNTESFFKKASYGLIEQDNSLFFCQIDYFGDVFVLEWNEFKDKESLEWTQFTIEGDKFESWMSLSSRDLSVHKTQNTFRDQDISANQLNNSHRFHLPNGFLHEKFYKFEDRTLQFNVYYCRFKIETQICKCKLIFSTWCVFNNIFQSITPMANPESKAPIFFLKKTNVYAESLYWEQIIVGQIPSLLHLTCLAVNKVLNVNQHTSNRSIMGRIVQELRKGLAKIKRNTFTRETHRKQKELNLANKKLRIRHGQDIIVLPNFTYSQLNNLMGMVKNKFC